MSQVVAEPDGPRTVAAPTPWHAIDAASAVARLGSAESGLSGREARARLEVQGPNSLPEARGPGLLVRFLGQFRSVLIYVLFAAAAGAAGLGRVKDALVILAVVFINALIGLVQEGRAERALVGVRRMLAPTASVLRDGVRVTLPADELVPGDVVLLEAGDRAPADLRLLRAASLRIEEAALTGEALPVEKAAAAVEAAAALGDRTCMVYCGSLVAAGSGRGLVVATGPATELGRISSLAAGVKRAPTPLVRQMDRFARQLSLAVGVLSVAAFAAAYWGRGQTAVDAFMIVVGLAVAAIPEGLPAVMTIALALGVGRMAARRAVIRNMPAVETLGSVSVICSDKTGTLTRNEMMVTSAATPERTFGIGGGGYAPVGEISQRSGVPSDPERADLVALATAALLCNDARIAPVGAAWAAHGDPMEAALLAFAGKVRPDWAQLRAASVRRDEIPFDAQHRYMASLDALPDGQVQLFVKGAPERILAMCGADTAGAAGRWDAEVHALAAEGRRVLALAARSMPHDQWRIEPGHLDGGLALLGLVGLEDPPREAAFAAVAACREAGIVVKMITGDHAATAAAIARQLKLADDPQVVTGRDLAQMDEDELVATAERATVFARTSPEDKLRLVRALQARGHIVAMTGDGVNDAPALRQADVGVAMGRKGTEAAKAAAQMVLVDDDFASIVAAVREGRIVYANLKKMIAMALPTNGGETAALLVALLFGFALPLTPVQLLWVNMVTGVALELTLAFERGEAGIMQHPPRPPREPLLDGRLAWQVLFVTLLFVAGTTGAFFWAMDQGLGLERARTLVVNVLVILQVAYLLSVRGADGAGRPWEGLLAARAVMAGAAVVLAAQAAFTYLPAFNVAFETRPLGWREAGAVAAIGLAGLGLAEAEKGLARRLRRSRARGSSPGRRAR
ncbi:MULTISPECIES: HAD-IC family P-type ATPase [unclassified Phenylobacterium]|uniref:cation-translocating P-type ATPase n=1 Tax=unclassified Phenylobacterium TaxID=2640670 RepID=UPI00083A3535|nr:MULTISPECIES: HAD-IC family P-type ATPase [unclassified Phenylobacterium]